jgi:hypothetical protein
MIFFNDNFNDSSGLLMEFDIFKFNYLFLFHYVSSAATMFVCRVVRDFALLSLSKRLL